MRRRLHKEKLRALKRQLAASLAQQRQQLRNSPIALRRRRQRIRRGLWAALALLLLALLYGRCSCDEAAVVSPAAEPATAPVPKVVPAPSVVAPIKGRLGRRRRPPFVPPVARPQTWVERFRLQVLARGPRLARCFDGSENPGALRWSAAVDALRGVVSDQTFDPVDATPDFSAAQRSCLSGVLSEPAYRLAFAGVADLPSTPQRVGIVVEF